MKIAYLIIVILHGLIHLLGFFKGFGISAVKELSLPISKPMGTLWLATSFLFILYAILYLTSNKYGWLIAFLAVVISQILVFLFWKDAKVGTLPNLLVLGVAIVSFGYYSFQQRVEGETMRMLAQNKTGNEKIIEESDLKDLPVPIKRWLRHCGVIGKPNIHVGKVRQRAQMKLKPEQENWMRATAWQFTTIDPPAFIWMTDVNINSLLYFQGRDKFKNGEGEMLIKINSLINVVNEQGYKIDEGALQRYLGEMVWFPSLALSPYITWEPIDSTSAKATLSYQGTEGSGTFYFNSAGDFVKFSALRYMGNEAEAKRHEWVLLATDYQIFEGIKVPAKMTATWKLEEQNWTWLELEILDIKYNHNVKQ